MLVGCAHDGRDVCCVCRDAKISHHGVAPTTVRAFRFRSQFDSSIVGSSSRVSMEGSFDKCPPEARELEARESMAKPGIEDIEREAMVRKKRIIEAGGREEKSPRKEEDSPGVTEEVLYMNQPNPPLANKMQEMPQQKVQTDATVWVENQIQFGATVGGSLTEISLADGGEFDVTFKKGAMILLRTPGATENSEAPRPSKKPKEDVDDPQEKTPLRQSS